MEEKAISKKEISPGFILFMMLMSMTAGAMCLNKVAPIATTLTQSMGLTGTGQLGLLISVFVFSGIFLAIPSGVIISKLGNYKTGIIALAATFVGSLIGGLNPGYGIMLASRIIEGIGLIMLGTIGPACVSTAFSDEKRGAAMGLLMCFMNFGQIIMLNLAPRMAIGINWESVWWMTTIYSGIFLVFWVLMLKNLDASLGLAPTLDANKKDVPSDNESTGKKSLLPREIFTNKGVWLMGVVFLIFMITEQGVISFLPAYLTSVRGIDEATAGSITSFASIIGIPVAIGVGAISDKIGSRKKPIGALLLLAAVSYALIPVFPTNIFLVLVTVFGIAVMGIAGLCFSAAAELVSPENGSMVVAFINTFQWIGIFLSSTIAGMLIQSVGWGVMFYVMTGLSVLGAVVAFVVPKLR